MLTRCACPPFLPQCTGNVAFLRPKSEVTRHWLNLNRKKWLLFSAEITESTHISKSELKKLIEEAMINVLIERKDLLEDAVAEAIIDMNLALSIEAGDTGEYVSEKEIMAKLMD